jgi:hypothetical protein
VQNVSEKVRSELACDCSKTLTYIILSPCQMVGGEASSRDMRDWVEQWESLGVADYRTKRFCVVEIH